MGYLVILALLLVLIPLVLSLSMAGRRRRRNDHTSVSATQPAAEGAAVGKGPPDARPHEDEPNKTKGEVFNHGPK